MPDHIDRYAAISDIIKKRIGRKLECFFIIGVDETGESYYGADYGENRINQKEMLSKARHLVRQLVNMLR